MAGHSPAYWQPSRNGRCSVDLEQDDLLYFEADQAIRDVVLGSNDSGTNDPFLGDLFLLDEDGF